MSAIKITDKEIDRIYPYSEEMHHLSSYFYKKFGKTSYSYKSGYIDEFKEWLIENWLYVKDKNRISGIKNQKLISRNAFRLDFKWTPELRFLKTFNTYLADKLANQEVKKGDIIEIRVYEHDFKLEIIGLFSNDCEDMPLEVDETILLKVNEDTIISFDAPKIEDEILLKKFRALFKISSHVRLDMLKNILDLPVNQFINKITEWKREFNFEIGGDFIYFTKEDPSELINKLEESFALWKDSEQKSEKITYKIANRELKSTFSSSDIQLKEKLLYTLQKLENQDTRRKETQPVRDLKPKEKEIDFESTEVILSDPKLAALKHFDLDRIFDFFSSSQVPKRLMRYSKEVFITLLAEHGIFKKLNTALNSSEFTKRQKAFNVYQLFLLKKIHPLEIRRLLNENFKDLAVIAQFQKSAEIPFYGSQMKEDKLYYGKYGRKINFTFENNHITDIYIENPTSKPIKAFGTFNYELLGQLESLESLEIKDDMFKSIPSSFRNLKKLTVLQIRSSSLYKAPDFSSFGSLEILSLNCENLLEFPIGVGKLKKLIRLSLILVPMLERSDEKRDRYAQKSHRKEPSGIPDTIGELDNLTSLTLMCDLTVPPPFIQYLKNLKVLRLSTNFINRIPEWIGNLTNLEKINISENQIRFLPESFGNLNKVTNLDLHQNQLQSLPESFGNLTALKKLNLYINEITHLPESFGKLKQLEWIHLRKNRLSKLPKSIGNMSSLKTMMLGENQLIEIPKTIGKLSFLESLNLDNNKLTEIPSTIGNLNSLIRLNLNRNQLSDVPKEIGNLNNLEKLTLSDNQLNKMERFRDLTSLKELDLRNNLYSEIKGLEKMVNLTRLYLENTKIPDIFIDELGGLRKDGYVRHTVKFVEYCKKKGNEDDIKGFREESRALIIEKFLKEELRKQELEDDIYYELIRPEMISKNFTKIINIPEFPINQFLDVIKRTPLLNEKYLEIIAFKKLSSEYDRSEFLKVLLEVSTEVDLEKYIFDIFGIPEQIHDATLRVRSFCSLIDKIKTTKLFEKYYSFIEEQFTEALRLSFLPGYSIGSFYNLIKSFKGTILLKKQYEIIELKFLSFLRRGFTKELNAQSNYNSTDVEYWRVNHLSNMIQNFKGTPLLKSHSKEIEDLIHTYVKNEDRIQNLMKELHLS